MFSSLLCHSYPAITNSQKLLFNSNVSTTVTYWLQVYVKFSLKESNSRYVQLCTFVVNNEIQHTTRMTQQ